MDFSAWLRLALLGLLAGDLLQEIVTHELLDVRALLEALGLDLAVVRLRVGLRGRDRDGALGAEFLPCEQLVLAALDSRGLALLDLLVVGGGNRGSPGARGTGCRRFDGAVAPRRVPALVASHWRGGRPHGKP